MDILYLIISIVISFVLFTVAVIAIIFYSKNMNRRLKKMERGEMKTAAKISQLESMSKEMAENSYMKAKNELSQRIEDESHKHRNFMESAMLKERKLHNSKIELHARENKEKIRELKKGLGSEIRQLMKEKQSLKKELQRHNKEADRDMDRILDKLKSMKKQHEKTAKSLKESRQKTTKAIHKKIKKRASKKAMSGKGSKKRKK